MPGMRDDFNRTGYDNLPGVTNPPGRMMAPEGGTNYRPPTAVETSALPPFPLPNTAGRFSPNLNAAPQLGQPGLNAPQPVPQPQAVDAAAFETMTLQELLAVDPATLTRDQWPAYDAALTRAAAAMGPQASLGSLMSPRGNGAALGRLGNTFTAGA